MPRELKNAKITHVSYVDRAANQKKFFLMKAKKRQPDFQKEVSVLTKAEDAHRLVYGVVYEPNTPDAHQDFMSAKEIERAAHGFMKDARHIDKQHDFQDGVGEVVESYIAPADFEVGGELIRKGSWVLVTKASQDIWDQIQQGHITGYSMAGTADIVAIEEQDQLLSQGTNERGLFSLLKNFFLKEEGANMSQQFWSALDHLLETLQSSDGDESSVRAALEQLIPIVQDVLKTDDVLQTVGERPASVQKQDAALTTDQVRELEKAKMAIENVLQQAEHQDTDQAGEEPVQKVLEQVVAPIRHQLSSLEKSASREKLAMQQVLQQQLLPISERIHMLEKARGMSKQTIHDTQNDSTKPIWDGLL
ncbi:MULTISPECIES: XkdF-like putative serine protease domain-containing protein [Bacillus]|uniref:XkdF-like putative serine protease domain-containing protein n=1 Tax=Bacillus TaxID=1386 RepID=UPI000D01625F|nr:MULTISPECIES: XkdF-like putative serine protease domain-containing protein [Bacillus]MDR0125294.1 XkdF-like putative serine protease domain-containing protein [Bacillus zhangzhouensis]PRO41518.1 terminase [Bacillus sp. LLTC93]